MSHDKKFQKISRGFLLFSTGMFLVTSYDAYHTLKEYDKLSLTQELGDEDILTFSVYREEKSGNTVLSIISFNPDSNYKLSDEDYEKLNQLLHNEMYPISKLNLIDIGNEIDFSKVDLSGITDIYFQGVQDNFDYAPFSGNTFDVISFFSASTNESLKDFFKSTDLEYSTVDVSNEDFDVISCLEEVGKIPNILDINVYGGFYGETLPDISAREVNMFYYFDYYQLLDIDLSLSDKVEEANFSFATLHDDSQDISLDDLSVYSNNSDLELSFVNDDDEKLSMELSSVSSIELPDGSYATFENIDFSDNNLFTTFDNLSGFSYTDTQGREVSYIDRNSSNPKVKSLRYQ